MRLGDLPTSTPTMQNVSVLDAALRAALGPGAVVRDIEILEGTDHTVYVLRKKARTGVSWDLQPIQAAQKLMEDIDTGDVRFIKRPASHAVKGWEIRAAVEGGERIAIAFATWFV